jgi:uncharacterized membrane protein SpoIIM required for sporulation
MDYSTFVGDRRVRWDRFEGRLNQIRQPNASLDHETLEELAVEYRVLLHDHAFARARFPNTGAAKRLERLAVRGTRLLRRGGRGPRFSVTGFFRETFPSAFRTILPELGLCAVLFLLTACLGYVLGIIQPDLGLKILGPERIHDLKTGKLWTESLTSMMPATSSSLIATNNISVALTGWAGGAAAGLGAFYIVLFNGLHLGSIFAVTTHFGMAGALGEFVAAHGPLEILLILVCSAAGLGLGRSLVVAEDRPRAVVVKEQARQSLTVLIGCLPWFVVLAVVEAIVSPSLATPAPVKIALGAALFLIFIVIATRNSAEVARDH